MVSAGIYIVQSCSNHNFMKYVIYIAQITHCNVLLSFFGIENMYITNKSQQILYNGYQPVFNLCFIAKIFEKLVLSQVSSYFNSQNLYNSFSQHVILVTVLKQLF